MAGFTLIDTKKSEEVKPRSVSYDVDMGFGLNTVASHGFLGAVGTISWNPDKKQWLEYIVTKHVEPEWGQEDAGQESETPLEPKELNDSAIQRLLELYNINSTLLERRNVPFIHPYQLEKIADIFKTRD